ncbi:hypothetical protein MVEN_01224200 [Mycena venus]|uniref:Uncharacterized protein n=1 Tax=Mycena venus TaxID=2733690 RepID=A0A8H7CY90_9AGAR|nr:hypothetical protein MVEN_01224200 [Mycena venus]
MGNNESNDHRPVVSNLFVQNSITRYLHSDSALPSTKPRAEAAPSYPKVLFFNLFLSFVLLLTALVYLFQLARSDTTTAQAGSPTRSLFDDEQSVNKDPDTSHSSANSSFPISESALPANFDTSGDFAPAELSHFFPLPPNKIDTSGSQKPFATPSDSPSSPSLHKPSMSSFNDPKDKKSLQDTLDALWAPPKHVTVRVSAPNTPVAGPGDDLLIDFSSEAMPTMSSFPAVPALVSSTSADTSYDMKSSRASSANRSSEMKVGPPRHTETLTQVMLFVPFLRCDGLLASHPELGFGQLESSPKHVKFQPNFVTDILLTGDDEPIKLPPVTYADATNASLFLILFIISNLLTNDPFFFVLVTQIASKYPELAEKVLKEPIATPVQAHKMLEPEPEDEAGCFPDAQQMPPTPDTSMKEPEPAMPEHTWDRPNWARAPATAEDYEPRATRRPRQSNGDRDGNRGNSSYGGGGYGRRQSSGGGAPRVVAGAELRRRAGDGHDAPPHMRHGGGARGGDDVHGRGGGDDSYSRAGNDSYRGGDQRLPTRPSATRADSWNASARVDEPASASASAGGGGDVDDWSGTSRDAWGVPAPAAAAEPKSDARGAPAAVPAEPKQDAWGAPPAPAPAAEENRDGAPTGGDEWSGTERDAWGRRLRLSSQSKTPGEERLRRTGPPRRPPTPQAVEAVYEWEPTHDPWTAPAPQPTEARNTSYSQAPALASPPQSQSFREEALHRDETAPAANDWMANHDPWTSGGGGGDENHGHQQSQKQLEPENKRETPSSIRGDAPSPFRDRMNDSNNSSYNRTPNRSVNEGSFSANVLDVRAPSQASVAALAASRGANASESRNDAPAELPVEFNYFLHSETADWLGSGPTNPSQNSFSPSQNLVTPARELTPVVRTPPRQRSPPVREREISAPAPRNTDSFDYNQQPQDNGGDNWGVKQDYRRGRSDDQWGASDGKNREREFNDGGRGGYGRDGPSPGYGGRHGGEDYGRRGGDEYGRRGEDEHGRRGDDYGRSGGDNEYGRRGGTTTGDAGAVDPVGTTTKRTIAMRAMALSGTGGRRSRTPAAGGTGLITGSVAAISTAAAHQT